MSFVSWDPKCSQRWSQGKHWGRGETKLTISCRVSHKGFHAKRAFNIVLQLFLLICTYFLRNNILGKNLVFQGESLGENPMKVMWMSIWCKHEWLLWAVSTAQVFLKYIDVLAMYIATRKYPWQTDRQTDNLQLSMIKFRAYGVILHNKIKMKLD